MKIKIPALVEGSKVAIPNCADFAVVAKRAGKNLYWVTFAAGFTVQIPRCQICRVTQNCGRDFINPAGQ
jgi:hypothetical protein